MYLKEELKKYENNKIDIYVDMDGVIADYNVGVAYDYDKKRPLYTSLEKLEEISKLTNVTLHILSITRMTAGREEKNIWLDKYAPFFLKENRNIISREENNFEESSNLKVNYLKKLDKDNKIIILIDDDPLILHTVRKEVKDIILYKDTVLVD